MKIKKQNNFALLDKVCIITGGAGLLGSAFAKECLLREARVVLVDIDEERGRKTVRKIIKSTGRNRIIFEKCDIKIGDEVRSLVSRVHKRYGKIDALVNSAYPRNKNFGKKFEDVSFEDFCENVSMHLGGYFLMTKEVARVMKKQHGGVIVMLGSIYGFSAPKFEIYKGTDMTVSVEYAALKGGILNLIKYLAAYLGPHGIRVNALSPGGVFDGQPKSFVDKYSMKVPLSHRMAYPKDISPALVFLLSDASQYITGQNIVVDGGWSI